MNGAGGAGAGDAMQQKRAAAESEEQRALKQMKTEAAASSNMAQANAMAASQAMFGSQPFFMNSQSMQQTLQMAPQSMMGLMNSIPASQAQSQRQIQQQYAAAMSARQNAQQQRQQQAVTMAAMMGHQNVSVVPAAMQQGLQNRVSAEDLTKGGATALSVRCKHLEVIAGYPIKPFAEKFIEPYLQRWIREKLLNVDRWMMNVREVFTVMIGLYSLKRACIAHNMLEKVIGLIEARKLTATDYFGWHPAIEGPTVRCSSLCAICGIRNLPEVDVCSRCQHKLAFPSVFTKFSGSILAAFYAEQLGIQLGATTLDVFAHTNTVRGMYTGLLPIDTDGVMWGQFADQLRMIFSFLDVMSDFGALQLNPDLFVPEVNIIFNAAYVNQAMLASEYEVVGKFLQCMKLFGRSKTAENLNMISSCERFLLFKQLPTGSWCKVGAGMVDQYKATVTCSK
ncbi:hypothetical protein BBO99_00001845 [Phytophthora kernoviae]|uniref:Uncharacterized protein n=2 Tax=Phytophthora kernoviae TaxID=325452 RepID=A0A3R7JAQ1_9STRA|nr:hypothetical protein G195_001785 [Phytophthora kernoviae 00238/432]KAG2531597.1 hypothetical protein JM18_001624 [Phytophthora kernoviae]RLN31790.1 hypothetical protein BBI17_001621 [Phytophthora kernoviae]RLN83728.1 hypothetical protein BBO99_00001845 [Phytophthora kernoviae]